MKTSSFLVLLFATISSQAQVIENLEIPKSGEFDTIVNHAAYSLSYNQKHRQANWVAYLLTKEETNNEFERDDKFKADPLVKNSDNALDYKKSGYDRGHLAPAADMGFSEITMQESFYYSNMSPQLPSFNRGIWKRLEDQTRDWAKSYDSLYIVTGPILTDSLPTIGQHCISVPKFYYKVILNYKLKEQKAIAFILANEASKENLSGYAVTIDELEKLSGIDFFPLLPDKEENELEAQLCIACWEF